MNRLLDIAGQPEDFRARVYHSPQPPPMSYADAEAYVLRCAAEPNGWTPPNDDAWRALTDALELSGRLETRFYTFEAFAGTYVPDFTARRIYVDACRWHVRGAPFAFDEHKAFGRGAVLLAIGRGSDHVRAEKHRAALLQAVWRTPSDAPDYAAKVAAVQRLDRAEYDRCNPELR